MRQWGTPMWFLPTDWLVALAVLARFPGCNSPCAYGSPVHFVRLLTPGPSLYGDCPGPCHAPTSAQSASIPAGMPLPDKPLRAYQPRGTPPRKPTPHAAGREKSVGGGPGGAVGPRAYKLPAQPVTLPYVRKYLCAFANSPSYSQLALSATQPRRCIRSPRRLWHLL